MAQQSNVSLNSPKKPSKLLALIAMLIAFSLPFILVKMFPHKNKSVIDNIPLTLPTAQDSSFDEVEESEDSEEAENTSKASESSKANTPQKDTETPESTPIPKPVSKSEWKIVKIQKQDSIARVFNRIGLNNKILATIMKDTSHSKILKHLRPKQELQFLITEKMLEKMIIPFSNTQYLIINREGQHYKSTIKQRKMNSHNHFLTATIMGSLYGTAKRLNIPYKLIQQMTEIFTWDINFAKDVRAGDQFTIMYKAFYIDDKLINTGDIVAVSYTNKGKTFQAVRHTNRAGASEYYTPLGNSLKKAFTRYPLRFSHISSSFSLGRYHPILHYTRAHKGVDLAARIGTPIQATGDGRIEIIGNQSGYANMIKIKHNNTYSSIYGHMLKFQKGLSKGSFVKRGQVIGFVGQTGLASGPHCHYEFHVNNQPKNPTTLNLPRGDSISKREFARFKSNTNTLLAQLKLFEKARLASSSQKSSSPPSKVHTVKHHA